MKSFQTELSLFSIKILISGTQQQLFLSGYTWHVTQRIKHKPKIAFNILLQIYGPKESFYHRFFSNCNCTSETFDSFLSEFSSMRNKIGS